MWRLLNKKDISLFFSLPLSFSYGKGLFFWGGGRYNLAVCFLSIAVFSFLLFFEHLYLVPVQKKYLVLKLLICRLAAPTAPNIGVIWLSIFYFPSFWIPSFFFYVFIIFPGFEIKLVLRLMISVDVPFLPML